MATEIWVNIGSGNGLVPINWTNVDLSSVRSSDIHLRASSQEIPQPSITEISLKITYPKFHWNLPGANEWTKCGWTGPGNPWDNMGETIKLQSFFLQFFQHNPSIHAYLWALLILWKRAPPISLCSDMWLSMVTKNWFWKYKCKFSLILAMTKDPGLSHCVSLQIHKCAECCFNL